MSVSQTALSVRFGRGKPPSSDLRDYLSEDDKWMLGVFLFDDPTLRPWIESPEWGAHLNKNSLAMNTVTRVWDSAIDSQNSAWERYWNPGMPDRREPQGPQFRPQLAVHGVTSGGSSVDEKTLADRVTISFGAPRDLGQVNALLFATGAAVVANWHRSFAASPVQPGLSFSFRYEVAGKAHAPIFTQSPMMWGTLGLTLSESLNLGDLEPQVIYRDPPATLAKSRLRKDRPVSLFPVNPPIIGSLVSWLEYPDGTYARHEEPVYHTAWDGDGYTRKETGMGLINLAPGDFLPPGGYRAYVDFWADKSITFNLLSGGSTVIYAGAGLGSMNARDLSRPASRVPVAEVEVYDLEAMSVSFSRRPELVPDPTNGDFGRLLFTGARANVFNPFPVPLQKVTVVVSMTVTFSNGAVSTFETFSDWFSIQAYEAKAVPVKDFSQWFSGGDQYPKPVGLRNSVRLLLSRVEHIIETKWRPL